MRLPVTRATITLDVAHCAGLLSLALPGRTWTGLTASFGGATGAGAGAGAGKVAAATFVKAQRTHSLKWTFRSTVPLMRSVVTSLVGLSGEVAFGAPAVQSPFSS